MGGGSVLADAPVGGEGKGWVGELEEGGETVEGEGEGGGLDGVSGTAQRMR